MTKFQKAITSAFCLVLVFTILFAPADKSTNKQIMLFPGISFGYAQVENNDKKVEVVKSKKDVEFSFKIFELLSEWF